MDRGQHLALTAVWWAWDHPLVRKAVNGALLDTWTSMMEDAFKCREGNGCRSGSMCVKAATTIADWRQLTALRALRRDPRNIRRLARGANNATPEFLLGLATVLHVNVRDLYPETTEEWVAQATVFLGGILRRRGYGDRPPTASQARAYAAFRVANPPDDGKIPTVHDTQELLALLPAAERDGVLITARSIGAGVDWIDSQIRGNYG